MTFEEFCSLTDLEKLIVVEIQPRKEIEAEAWSEESQHQDIAHSDSPHLDTPHSDGTSHGDTSHADVAHVDTPAHADHGDTHYDHNDGGYLDHWQDWWWDNAHSDTPHSDTPHSDHSDHSDNPHSDVAYGDVDHADQTDYIYSIPFSWGEVVKLTERVSEHCDEYDRKFSKSDLFSALGSFLYDCENQILWIHTSENDAPDTLCSSGSGSGSSCSGYKYCLLAFFWIGLCNYQPKEPSAETPIIAFEPQDSLCGPIYYLPYLPSDAIGSCRASVGEYHIGDIPTFDIDIKLNNDGFFYRAFNELYFENARIEVKIGDIRALYDDLAVFFTGVVRRKDIDDNSFFLNCKDTRQGAFREIPLTRYDDAFIAAHPNIDPNAKGWPIPIAFGLCYDYNPVCIDSINFIYKLCAYPINSVLAVYKDGAALILGVDYNVDLAAAEITLLANPGNSKITADIEGILCDMTTGLYSTNLADFLYFVLNVLNEIPAADLDAASFLALKAARTATCGWMLKDPTATKDFIRILQVSGLFHLIPDLRRKFRCTYYSAGAESDTPEFLQDEMAKDPPFRRALDTERIREKVIINYRYSPNTGKWRSVESSFPKTICRFDEHEAVSIDTVLVVDSEAKTIADLHLAMLCYPGDYAVGRLNSRLLAMLPTEKIILNKIIEMEQDELIRIFDNECFLLLSLDKSLVDGRVDIIAINNAQAAGEYHTDTPHADHTDGSHEDGSHSDHDDTYSDHDDILHADAPHSDAPHEDVPHGDYSDYDDNWDPPHHDDHMDHEDDPYQDHTDSTPHEDVSHEDHNDYYDAPHEDGAHADHSDYWHEDSPHGDAEY